MSYLGMDTLKPLRRAARSRDSRLVEASLPVALQPLEDVAVCRRVYPFFKRVLDMVLALGLLAVCAPILLATALVLKVRQGSVIRRTPRAGLFCAVFDRFSFEMPRGFMKNWPVLFNILRGDLSFVGPRAASPGEMCGDCGLVMRQVSEQLAGNACCAQRIVHHLHVASSESYISARERAARIRNSVRPGLICDWWVRRHANLAYDLEVMTDAEYVLRQGLRHDLGIVFRALPALFLAVFFGGSEHVNFHESVRIQRIRIDNITMREAIGRVMRYTRMRGNRQVCFVNPQCANAAYENETYQQVLDKADLVLSDGIGMKIAGMILRRPIRENVNGTDMFPRLCKALSLAHRSVFLLGAEPGVAKKVADWMEANHPGIQIKGCRHGYFGKDEEAEVIAQVAESGADVLFVAMGAPRQEVWIQQNLERLGVPVAMGVGGLFDFYSGRRPRAPLWMRELGMEWLFRMWQEPGRMWKRYIIGNNVFLYHILKERFLGRNAEPSAPSFDVPRV